MKENILCCDSCCSVIFVFLYYKYSGLSDVDRCLNMVMNLVITLLLTVGGFGYINIQK